MSDSSSKLIQQPQIRAADGQKASLKIGERVPVATGSFQPGIGGVGINPLVNTQFNYIDVGVNVDITPRVHGLDEVTLKVAMDISAIDRYQDIGGISQPVIGQRKIEQEIRLREGEVNIMGGILENTQTKSLSGIPGLASIPLFKYLFSEETKQDNDNEIIFILIPHIVRAQDFPALPRRPATTARRCCRAPRRPRGRLAVRRGRKAMHRSRRPARLQPPSRSRPRQRPLRAVRS